MRRGLLVFATTSILFALLAVAVERGPHAYAHEYVVNGGFEDGTAGWSSPSAAFAAVDAADVPPLEGMLSGRVTLTQSLYVVRRSAFGVPPGTYTASAGIRRTVNSPQVLISVENQAATFTELPGPGGWSIVSSTFIVGDFSNLNIIIDGSGNVGDVFYIDALHIDGPNPITPQPSATNAPTDTPSPTVTATGTRTPSPTRTPTATRTPSPAAPAIDGALQNGGFEVDVGGEPAAWHRYGGALSLATSPVRSGGYAARFASASDSTKWIYQAVAVESGATYAFDAWVYDGDSEVAAAYLRVSWYASADAEGASLGAADSTSRIDAPESGFRRLSTGPITVPAEAHSARLRVMLAPLSAAHAVIYVDDATFGPAVTDPASTSVPISAAEDASVTGGAAPEAPSTTGADRATLRTAIAPPPNAASVGRVVVNEVMYNPGSAPEDNSDGEWVELYNAADAPIDLNGWSLADAASRDVLPSRVMNPREFVVVAASVSISKTYPLFSGAPIVLGGRIGNGLGNDGDRLLLYDASGAIVDAISWGREISVLDPSIPDVPAGHSIERRPPGVDTDAAADFADNLSPSPGGPMPARAVESAHLASPNLPVDITTVKRGILPSWAPRAAMVVSAVALAVALGWRAVPFVRRRLHFGE